MSDYANFICIDCGKEFSFSKRCLMLRKERTGKSICANCYHKINKGGRYGKDYYPVELRNLLKEDFWDYEIIKPYLNSIRTKKKIRFICQECNNEEIMQLNVMRRRKICSTQPICRKCSLKFATNSKEWRENNSKAQFIAQNRPEVLEKQRNSQLKLMESDPLFCDKRCSKSYVSGKIRGFRFNSSWELYYLAYCWESKEIKSIKRYDGYMDYFDGKGILRKYFPDFIVDFSDGKSKIIEIKGSKKYNNFHEKFNAARKKHGINYIVYEEKDLVNLGINFRRETFLREFYRKYYNEILFDDNERIRNLKKRIEEWLK